MQPLTPSEVEAGVVLSHGALRPTDVAAVETMFSNSDKDGSGEIGKKEFKVP